MIGTKSNHIANSNMIIPDAVAAARKQDVDEFDLHELSPRELLEDKELVCYVLDKILDDNYDGSWNEEAIAIGMAFITLANLRKERIRITHEL